MYDYDVKLKNSSATTVVPAETFKEEGNFLRFFDGAGDFVFMVAAIEVESVRKRPARRQGIAEMDEGEEPPADHPTTHNPPRGLYKPV